MISYIAIIVLLCLVVGWPWALAYALLAPFLG